MKTIWVEYSIKRPNKRDTLSNQNRWTWHRAVEKMPDGENCARAKELKITYLGRLVPISRFVLLAEDGLHYSEGIAYPGYANGGYDISTGVENAGKKPRALWVDTEKRPGVN